jgi:hypothetical protein
LPVKVYRIFFLLIYIKSGRQAQFYANALSPYFLHGKIISPNDSPLSEAFIYPVLVDSDSILCEKFFLTSSVGFPIFIQFTNTCMNQAEDPAPAAKQ